MYVINVINYKFTTSEQKSPKRGGKHTELWIDLSVFEVLAATANGLIVVQGIVSVF